MKCNRRKESSGKSYVFLFALQLDRWMCREQSKLKKWIIKLWRWINWFGGFAKCIRVCVCVYVWCKCENGSCQRFCGFEKFSFGFLLHVFFRICSFARFGSESFVFHSFSSGSHIKSGHWRWWFCNACKICSTPNVAKFDKTSPITNNSTAALNLWVLHISNEWEKVQFKHHATN